MIEQRIDALIEKYNHLALTSPKNSRVLMAEMIAELKTLTERKYEYMSQRQVRAVERVEKALYKTLGVSEAELFGPPTWENAFTRRVFTVTAKAYRRCVTLKAIAEFLNMSEPQVQKYHAKQKEEVINKADEVLATLEKMDKEDSDGE